MHNASTIAGMAFANAFLGISHSMAHKIGAQFHTIHGRTNAILLPYVIRYNGTRPAKTATWPKYNYYRADEKYQDIARMLGLPCSTPEEAVEAYAKAVYELGERVGIQMNFKAQGIDEKNGRNILVNWPSLLTKINVRQLTHVFQWWIICKKSSKMLTMVTKNVQDVVNKTLLNK